MSVSGFVVTIVCAVTVVFPGCQGEHDRKTPSTGERAKQAKSVARALVLPDTPAFQWDVMDGGKEAQEYVARTERELPRLRRDSLDVWEWSTEGGLLTSYSDARGPRRIDLTLYGEWGKTVSRFYVRNGEALVGECLMIHYAAPFYTDDPGIRRQTVVTVFLDDTTIVARNVIDSGDTTAPLRMWTGAEWQGIALDLADSVNRRIGGRGRHAPR